MKNLTGKRRNKLHDSGTTTRTEQKGIEKGHKLNHIKRIN